MDRCYRENYGKDVCSRRCRHRPKCNVIACNLGESPEYVHEQLQKGIRALERAQTMRRKAYRR